MSQTQIQIDTAATEQVPGLRAHALTVVGAGAVIISAVAAALNYFGSSDQVEVDTENMIGSLIFSLSAAAIALVLVAVIAVRPVSGIAKGVIGLAVLAGVSLLLTWWSGAPFIFGLAAFVLARHSGLLAKPSAFPIARFAGLFSGVVVVLSAALWVGLFISDVL